MLNFLKKEKHLCSVADGTISDITTVPDQVFSQKILGDGFAVFPSSNDFFSPASGIISDISETLHAYCITSDDGLEILLHIGLDTVELKGNGFVSKVKKGQKINQGDIIATADLPLIKSSGHNTVTMVVVTNTDKLKEAKVLETSSAKHGDKALIYKL